MSKHYFFTSESVSPGHPDKICDQISDTVLDECLRQDKHSRVAVETLVKDNHVVLAGELTTTAEIDLERLVKETVNNIGYDRHELGFCADSLEFVNLLGKQSSDIAQGVDLDDDIGAGDQGIMFGYAVNETENYMPFAIELAHQIVERQTAMMHNGAIAWLRPDAKSQVTIRYEEGEAVEISDIVLSTQHDEGIDGDELRQTVIEQIIQPLLPTNLKTDAIRYLINPTGQFIIGGPVGDCGLTGRKIIVDTYGGASRHGGGAFSGKDPTKVDRSAAYMMRYIAKNIVAAGLASRCEIQISYAIGVVEPVSILVNSFGTSSLGDERLAEIVAAEFSLTPASIIESLDLLNVEYQPTASLGHFGRPRFNWEKLDRVPDLKQYL